MVLLQFSWLISAAPWRDTTNSEQLVKGITVMMKQIQGCEEPEKCSFLRFIAIVQIIFLFWKKKPLAVSVSLFKVSSDIQCAVVNWKVSGQVEILLLNSCSSYLRVRQQRARGFCEKACNYASVSFRYSRLQTAIHCTFPMPMGIQLSVSTTVMD